MRGDKVVDVAESASNSHTPILSGEVLLRPHRRMLKRLKQLAGVPDGHWRALYFDALSAYAVFVQQLPRVDAGIADGSSLLEDGLKECITALGLRQGVLLPPAAEAHTLIEQQDVWTYATFTAMLCHGIAPSLDRLEVEVCDRLPSLKSRWMPVTGPMHGTTYRFLVRDDTNDGATATTPLLVHHLIPAIGLRWIAGHPVLLRQWSMAIAGRLTQAGTIGTLVANASVQPTCDTPSSNAATQRRVDPASTMVEGDVTNNKLTRPTGISMPADGTNPTEATSDPGDMFLGWLRAALQDATLRVNESDSRVHMTDEGLLLESPAIFRAFDHKGWAHVQRAFVTHRLHRKNADGGSIHRYRLCGMVKTKVIKGLLIPNPETVLAGIDLPEPNPQLTKSIVFEASSHGR